jgi:hypothetical protein
VQVEEDAMNRHWKLSSVVLLFGVVCCNDGDPDPSLSVGRESEEDWSERRARMNVVVEDEFGNTILQDPWNLLSLVADDCRFTPDEDLWSWDQCYWPLEDYITGSPDLHKPYDGATCRESACVAQLKLCMAHTFLELSTTVAPRTLGEVEVPPQSSDARTGLAEVAYQLALSAVPTAGEALLAASDLEWGTSVCLAGQANGDGLDDDLSLSHQSGFPRIGEVLAVSMREGAEVAREALDIAVRGNLAAADADLTRIPSRERAVLESTRAPYLSRLHAAALVTGGPSHNSIFDATDAETIVPLGPNPNLLARRSDIAGFDDAVALIRDSAVHPSLVLDPEVSLSEFAAGQQQELGSVGARLAEAYGFVLPSDPDEALENLGVTRAAMAAAREYLADELRLFHRDASVQLPSRQVPGPEGTLVESQYNRYAAIATLPTRLPSAHWNAVSMAGTESTVNHETPTPLQAMRSAALSEVYLQDVARAVLANESDFLLTGTAANAIHNAAADAIRAADGFVLSFQRNMDETPPYTRVTLRAAEVDDVQLVRGVRAAQCATRGAVESQPCQLTENVDWVAPSYTGNEERPAGRRRDWQVESLMPSSVANEAELQALDPEEYTFYALRPRNLKVPTTASLANAGRYEVIASIRVPPHVGDTTDATSGSPEDQQHLENSTAPDPGNASLPATNCAGLSPDQRIPLENELSEDGDAFESSWRTYLRLARQAADEADALGEQLIASGLEVDARAEAGMEELEALCGTSIDLDALPSSAIRFGGEPPCDDGYVEVGGLCAFDPVSAALGDDEDADDDDDATRRLRECLGDDRLVPLVALGTDEPPLCVWRSSTRINEICQGGPGLPCPAPCDQLGTTPTSMTDDGLVRLTGNTSIPDGAEVVQIAEYMNIFGGGDEGSTPPGPTVSNLPELCSIVSVARAFPDIALDAMRAQGSFFRPDSLRRIAQQISFIAKPGQHFDLRVGGLSMSTGSLAGGGGGDDMDPDTVDWPCSGDPSINAILGSSGSFGELLSTNINCGSPGERANLARRVGRAVVTARALTGAPMTGIVFPGPVRVRFPDGPWFEGCELSAPTSTVRVYSCRSFRRADPQGDWPGRTTFGNEEDGGEVQFYCISNTAPPGEPIWDGESQPGTSDGPNYQEGPSGWTCVPFSDVGQFARHSLRHVEASQSVWRGLEHDSISGAVVYMLQTGLGPSVREYGLTNAWDLRGGRVVSGYSWLNAVGIQEGDAYDALELLCEAALERNGVGAGLEEACAPPNRVSSIDDIPSYRSYLRCVADRIEETAERSVFANVPSHVVSALSNGGIGSYPTLGGQSAENVSRLRQAMLELPPMKRTLASELRTFEEAVRQIESELRRLSNEGKITNLQLASTLANQMTACVQATASGNWQNPGSYAAGAAVCSNSIVQSIIATQVTALQQSSLDESERGLFAQFNQRLVATSEGLARVGDGLRRTQETINEGLASAESIRSRAQRAVARGLLADADETGRVYRVNTVMRRRYSTLQTRYQRAHAYAIQMAYLARRALEQRLGVDLETTDWEPSLVGPPSSWIGEYCQASGIDYGRLRDVGAVDFENYDQSYIGDYVRRLEGVVESYRLDQPFSDGVDTAVASLRDDVTRVRRWCEVPSVNLLRHASNLAVSDLGNGWVRHDCDAIVDESSVIAGNCVGVTAIGDGDGPIELHDWPFEGERPPAGFHVTFGEVDVSEGYATGIDEVIDDLTTDSAARWNEARQSQLRNYFEVTPERTYRVSWYARTTALDPMYMGAGVAVDPSEAIQVVDGLGDHVTMVRRSAGEVANGWERFFGFFVAETVDAEPWAVAVQPALDGTALVSQAIDVGGVMVEDVSDVIYGREATPSELDTFAMMSTCGADGMQPCTEPDLEDSFEVFNPWRHPPSAFQWTDETATSEREVCEDTTGAVFRQRHWRRVCDPSCPTGLSSCPPSTVTSRCYWETTFSVTNENIRQGEILTAAGIAQDNYNYRIESLAVNFVGTAIRDCSTAELPSTCYSSGYIPYTLEHLGPYMVLERDGLSEYEAPLFTGRIVHGRGLAAERYITNPISGADRSLVEPYTHRELRGRPFSGQFRLRVWDQAGVRLDRLEDVQLVLNYRYWTRLD